VQAKVLVSNVQDVNDLLSTTEDARLYHVLPTNKLTLQALTAFQFHAKLTPGDNKTDSVHQIDVEQMNTTFSTPTSKMVKHKNKEDV
jgi:hypothetical protein